MVCVLDLLQADIQSVADNLFVPVYIGLTVSASIAVTFVVVAWARRCVLRRPSGVSLACSRAGLRRRERRKFLKRWGPAYFQAEWTADRAACENKIGPLFFLDR